MKYISDQKCLLVPQHLSPLCEISKELFSLFSKFYVFKDFYFFTLIRDLHIRASKLSRTSHVVAENNSTDIYIVRFHLKGIGYKFLRSRKFSRWIRIELGYSVSTYVCIPASVKLFHKRDKLVIISQTKASLLNFANQVFYLRPADVYKGKGVRLTTRSYTTFKPGKQR
jgi:hypothetical protein